jgi:hypothetical protein
MIAMRLIVTLFLLCVITEAYSQKEGITYKIVHFTNKKYKVPDGGHLQGIQAYNIQGKEHLILTGSSNSFSYYITTEPDSSLELVKIFDAPYRHAGGCQIADGKLFVGVEDNIEKDKSKVVMIDLATKKIEPIIERSGTFKRSTAGAVAAAKFDGHMVVAVADWDSRNIDLYQSSEHGFDSVGTYRMPDSLNHSYQNINLLRAGEVLGLFGFYRTGNKNKVDVFEIENSHLNYLGSNEYKAPKSYSFRYGAGMIAFDVKDVRIYVCQRKIKKRNSVFLIPRLIPA